MIQQDYILACVAGLEVAVFGANENAGKPVVIVTHGRGGAAPHVYQYCRDLRDLGLIAIALDQRNHGRRLVDILRNGGWDRTHAADMYGIIIGTAMDIRTIIDMLPATLGIDTRRVGVTGGSLGGHVTLMAMAHDPRIAAGAALIGSGDFLRLMELRAAANNCPPGQFDQFFPASLREAVKRYDPINNPAAFADRPLLMTNGDADNLVQLECNQRFEAAARPHYTKPDRLKLSICKGMGHAIPPEMWNEGKEWLRRAMMNE